MGEQEGWKVGWREQEERIAGCGEQKELDRRMRNWKSGLQDGENMKSG